MHMADALLSPATGAAMWATTAATTAYCAKRVRDEGDPAKIPLMGVAGAFVFAGQMVNFTIPATGSSGHLGGGLLLALLLGPEAAFLVMASVLTVQALFFADGGLLALGANVFNLGFFPAFVAFPLVYRRIAGDAPTRVRVIAGSLLAAVLALQLGALGVVLQTSASGVSALPPASFALLMQPIHLAIGVVEGLVTAAVALFVLKAQPDLLARTGPGRSPARRTLRPILIGLVVSAVLVAGVVSVFASTDPDGLEWSIEKVTGSPEVTGGGPVHALFSRVQDATSFLPGYAAPGRAEEAEDAWPGDGGTATAGVVGSAIVLAVAAGAGAALRKRSVARARARDVQEGREGRSRSGSGRHRGARDTPAR